MEQAWNRELVESPSLEVYNRPMCKCGPWGFTGVDGSVRLRAEVSDLRDLYLIDSVIL